MPARSPQTDRLDNLSKDEAVKELRRALGELEDAEDQISSNASAAEDAEAEIENRDALLVRVYRKLEETEEEGQVLDRSWAEIKREAADLAGIGKARL